MTVLLGECMGMVGWRSRDDTDAGFSSIECASSTDQDAHTVVLTHLM